MSPKAQAIAEREAFVRANYQTMTERAMAKHCGVKTSCIESLCNRLGLKKTDKPRPLPWTPEQTKKFKRLFASHSNKDLAVMFERTVSAIEYKSSALGLKKSSEYRLVKAPAAAKRSLEAPQRMPIGGLGPMDSPRVHTWQKERITYTPETLPWKARALAQPWTPPSLAYRGQVSA